MAIKVGGVDVEDIRVGNTPVSEVYHGSTLIWPTEVTVTIAPIDPPIVAIGAVINFTSTVSGPVTTYQWRLDGVDIAGATSATYDHTTVAGDNGKEITCYVTNGGSLTAESAPSTLTVAAALSVTAAPAAAESVVGFDFVFTATPAGGVTPYLYQWQENLTGSWVNISGATGATYTREAAQADDTFAVRCRVRDSLNPFQEAFSNECVMTVYPAVTSALAVDNANSSPDLDFVFTCTPGGGDGTYNYQWQILPVGGSWTTIDGQTAATYTRTAAAGDDGQQIRARVSSSNSAWVGSSPITMNVYTVEAPGLSADVTQVPQAGGDVVLTATKPTSAIDPPNAVIFQRNVDGAGWEGIQNSTALTCTTTVTANTNFRAYWRDANYDDTNQSAPSATVSVTVKAFPTISITADPNPTGPDGDVLFTATASGHASLSWQERANSGAAWVGVGVGTATWTRPAPQVNGEQVRCVAIDNINPNVGSNVITLTVPAAPTVSIAPTAPDVTEGDIITFTATPAGGTTPYTYLWQENIGGAGWANISGETAATYARTTALADDTGKIRCVLRDALYPGQPQAISNVATMAVGAALPPPIHSRGPEHANLTSDFYHGAAWSVTAGVAPNTGAYLAAHSQAHYLAGYSYQNFGNGTYIPTTSRVLHYYNGSEGQPDKFQEYVTMGATRYPPSGSEMGAVDGGGTTIIEHDMSSAGNYQWRSDFLVPNSGPKIHGMLSCYIYDIGPNTGAAEVVQFGQSGEEYVDPGSAELRVDVDGWGDGDIRVRMDYGQTVEAIVLNPEDWDEFWLERAPGRTFKFAKVDGTEVSSQTTTFQYELIDDADIWRIAGRTTRDGVTKIRRSAPVNLRHAATLYAEYLAEWQAQADEQGKTLEEWMQEINAPTEPSATGVGPHKP